MIRWYVSPSTISPIARKNPAITIDRPGFLNTQSQSIAGRLGSTLEPGKMPIEIAQPRSSVEANRSKSESATIVDASVGYVEPSTRCLTM